jgi:hypothetical protein
MKIGRNDPCHCGSGQKYKKCCAAKDDAARSAEIAAQAAARAAASESAEETAAQANATGVKGAGARAMPANSPPKPPKGPPPPSPSMMRKRAV